MSNLFEKLEKAAVKIVGFDLEKMKAAVKIVGFDLEKIERVAVRKLLVI